MCTALHDSSPIDNILSHLPSQIVDSLWPITSFVQLSDTLCIASWIILSETLSKALVASSSINYLWLSNHGSCNGDTLSFATGKPHTAIANNGIVTMIELLTYASH
jgi:hypothetical protein